jgi:hypothetical protein
MIMGGNPAPPPPLIIQQPPPPAPLPPPPVPAPPPIPQLPPSASTPTFTPADAQKLFDISKQQMDEQLNDPVRGILPNQAFDAASRGVYESGFFPEQQARTLQDAQSKLANISTQPTLEAALNAQNSLSSFMTDQMNAAQNMAAGRALIEQQTNQSRENSVANYQGYQNLFGPSYAQPPGFQMPQIPGNLGSYDGGSSQPSYSGNDSVPFGANASNFPTQIPTLY